MIFGSVNNLFHSQTGMYESQEFQGSLAQSVLVFCLFGFFVWEGLFSLLVGWLVCLVFLFACFNPGLGSDITFLGNSSFNTQYIKTYIDT